MSNDQRASTHTSLNPGGSEEEESFRDIHALTPPAPSTHGLPRSSNWEPSSYRSTASDATNSSENFTTISREFNALVLAGSSFSADNSSTAATNNSANPTGAVETNNSHLDLIGEAEEETNPLAIVLDSQPMDAPAPATRRTNGGGGGGVTEVASVHRVKKEEVEAKIGAWQNAKVAKINNRFKREDAVINGWENEQVHKSTSWMKKIERKLEEKRAKAMEKMQNDIAKAHRKAEERRASAEAKRGTKVARVVEVANLMRAVGKPPSKRSFF